MKDYFSLVGIKETDSKKGTYLLKKVTAAILLI